MTRIGIIRERKDPPDTRVALTPKQCKQIQEDFNDVEIVVEPSPDRCFSDESYAALGLKLSSDLSNCDILIGVKEVPVEHLIPNKTYLFFSHTKKKQPYNKPLMKALIANNVQMVDYECLTFDDNQRILGFGVYAGIVGVHNGLLAYGKKFNAYDLPSATSLEDFQELIESYKQIKLPAIKIVVTGAGRVPIGVLDVLKGIGVQEVSPHHFLDNEYNHAVFTLLKDETLYERKSDGGFDRDEFHTQPELYKCLFEKYIPHTDVLVNGIYWQQSIDKLFTKEDVKRGDWRIKVIADITCDINGSVPINIGASTIEEPVYGIDKSSLKKVAPYQNTQDIIDIMAVDNLPNELPKDASRHFGEHIKSIIIPELLKQHSDIIKRGTICENGKLTTNYEYLSDYAYD